jgi:hypothetical protein
MEDLITNVSVLFDDKAPTVTSPPLPPAPVDQPTPNYTYGSAHTKVASVPAPMQTPVRQQALPQSPEDFTPRLPARPANSIHPSSRTNPTSPTKISVEAPGPATKPEQASPPNPVSNPIPLPENTPPPPLPSATSMLVGDDEQTFVPEEHHGGSSIREPASSLVRATRSPKVHRPMAPSAPTMAAGEPVEVTGGGPKGVSASPPVPGAYPS